MNHRNTFAYPVLAGLLFTSMAADARPSIPITDVQLYPGGATIVRTAKVRPGMKQVVVTGIPVNFDLQSMHVEASAGIRIGDIASTYMAGKQPTNPAEAALDDKIALLQDRAGALDAEIKSLELAEEYLTRQITGGSPPRTHNSNNGDNARQVVQFNPQQLARMTESYHAEMEKLMVARHKLNMQKRELTRNLDALKRDLAHLRSGNTDTRMLTVNLNAAQAGDLRISYQVNNAGWRPTYRATLNPETSKVMLERMAIISQKTGEDWSNVHLTLSTSQPRHNTSGTEPQPWLLGYTPPAYLSEAATREGLFADRAPAPQPAVGALSKMAASKAAKPEYVPPTFETQGMFDNQYDVPARASLPADGREVSVELTRQEVAVKQYFQVVPRQNNAVYVTAEAELPQGDWPSGNVQLYRSGSYIGNSVWNPQESSKMVLSFGQDNQVQVKATPVKSDSGQKGLFGNRTQRKIVTQYVFTNRHQRPITLKVLEAAPVSTRDDIKVQTRFDPKPKQMDWKDKRGVAEWEFNIKPQDSAKVRTDYEIETPS